MAIFPSLKVKAPKQSNHDLSCRVRTTQAPGFLVPILVEPVVAGDQVKFSLESLVKTYPALTPILGSFKLEITAFFAPLGLYVPRLHHNSSLSYNNESLPDANFPYFLLYSSASTSAVDYANNFTSSSSLLRYLGFPYRYVDKSSVSIAPYGSKRYNAIPVLMYTDIFRNYFANRQERNFPVYTDGLTASVMNVSGLDNLYENLENGQAIHQDHPDYYLRFMQSHNKPLGGLLTRCYLPDMKNVILSSTLANAIGNAVAVSTTGDSFTIDQFNLAKKLYKVYTLAQLAGTRFSEWVRAQYAVQPKTLSDRPTFIGSSSSEIVFEDVVQTGGGEFNSAVNPTGNVGDLAGRGRGYMSGKYHYFTADQPGYVMILASIVPRVDYYQFMHRHMIDTQLSDLFVNHLNGLGLQDVLLSDLLASDMQETDPTVASAPWDSSSDPFVVSLGKQPAWIHLMSSVNEIFGDLCEDGMRGWTLARPMNTDTTGNCATDVDPTAYIDPSLWNYAFADTSPLAQNFIMQYAIEFYKRSNVSKRLMPNF